MLPFSFAEFYKSRGGGDADRLFADYMANGSFPYIATMDRTKEKTDMYLEGIYNTVIVKDVHPPPFKVSFDHILLLIREQEQLHILFLILFDLSDPLLIFW